MSVSGIDSPEEVGELYKAVRGDIPPSPEPVYGNSQAMKRTVDEHKSPGKAKVDGEDLVETRHFIVDSDGTVEEREVSETDIPDYDTTVPTWAANLREAMQLAKKEGDDLFENIPDHIGAITTATVVLAEESAGNLEKYKEYYEEKEDEEKHPEHFGWYHNLIEELVEMPLEIVDIKPIEDRRLSDEGAQKIISAVETSEELDDVIERLEGEIGRKLRTDELRMLLQPVYDEETELMELRTYLTSRIEEK